VPGRERERVRQFKCLPFETRADGTSSLAPFLRWFCAGCLGVVIFIGLLLTFHQGAGDHALGLGSWPAATPTEQREVPTHDCEADPGDWRHKWSAAKKRWCCSRFGRGCLTRESATGGAPFNCTEDLSFWQVAWSRSKQAWCCSHHRAGCSSQPLQETPLHREREQQQQSRKRPPLREPSPPSGALGTYASPSTAMTSVLPPVDCDKFVQGSAGDQKRAWCCRHHGLGCFPAAALVVRPGCAAGGCSVTSTSSLTTSTSKAPSAFDCVTGFARWEALWSGVQQAWCCQHSQRGCISTTSAHGASPPAFDCSVAPGSWATASPAMRAWCCQHGGRGCTTTSSPPFDCRADLTHWGSSWSARKKAWCCRKGAHSCPVFECGTESDWATGWSPEKKRWCCQYTRRGCPVTSTPPYNCNDDFAKWSVQQRFWCCEHAHRGCSLTTHSTASTIALPYDCSKGFTNWASVWSEGKQSWCCQHVRRGCRSHTAYYKLGMTHHAD